MFWYRMFVIIFTLVLTATDGTLAEIWNILTHLHASAIVATALIFLPIGVLALLLWRELARYQRIFTTTCCVSVCVVAYWTLTPGFVGLFG